MHSVQGNMKFELLLLLLLLIILFLLYFIQQIVPELVFEGFRLVGHIEKRNERDDGFG